MTTSGYYRFPTLHDQTIVFLCEDDLWTVSASGGIARRLTSNLGEVSSPALSPDGQWLAFTGREEGHGEVYVMPALGGPAERLTFLGGDATVAGWTPNGADIVFASAHTSPFRETSLYALAHSGGAPRLLPTGPAATISFGPAGGRVIGRHTTDISWWKRYRGGLAGDIWIDAAGDGQWQRLLKLAGNVARPQWVGERIYLLADHEGQGSLYSCLPTGEDLRRHAGDPEYYLRHLSTDGSRLVYCAGGEISLFDPATGSAQPVAIDLRSPRIQRNRRYVEPARYLQSFDIHPEGHSVALTSRGQSFTMANWEGAVSQHGESTVSIDGVEVAVQHRLTSWLHDGQRLVVVSDAGGEEALEVYRVDGSEPPQRLDGLDIGRPVLLRASPTRDQVALTNHRFELILVDLERREAKVLDRSPYNRLPGLAWAPDGHWLAYGFFNSEQTSIIKVADVDSAATFEATKPVLRDEEPAWDPEGRYLYFLSARDFDPVYDSLHFELSFPRGMRPFLITLQRDQLSPFIPEPRAPGEKSGKKKGDDKTGEEDEDGERPEQPRVRARAEPAAETRPDQEAEAPPEAEPEGKDNEEDRIEIDFDGIQDRILAFPVEDGIYDQIRGIEGKVLFSWWPIEGSLDRRRPPGSTPHANGVLEAYDFGDQKLETLVDGITSFDVSMDAKTLIYRMGNRLRMVRAGDKPDNKNSSAPGRQNGWLDLGRPRVAVLPGAEWAQMYRHAWRLQRDQFWSEDMQSLDWQRVYRRYWPLVGRIATRVEFSDLLWEMQGELGTSHAYEFGGDYKPEPGYDQGVLGADFVYDAAAGGYRITHIVRGDPWDEEADSPLRKPGLNIAEGDVLLAVAGRRLSEQFTPQQALVNQAGQDVLLTFSGQDGDAPRTVTVKALKGDRAARYREWVESNRTRVHEGTDGRIGYLHIPDMGPRGYAEFHRAFLAEVVRDGLIVDVRYNGGGHVSQLLLEKLARRRIGYDVQRWGRPETYPAYAVLGPIVALTNEYAGSDGDIFSHAFKLMKLGPLIGKRTWGGVIGISPRDPLIDGGMTTQPEYSFWFEDVGWGVENYGTDPDIEVENTPADWVSSRDPQLDRAIAEARRLLEENPPKLPDFDDRPRKPLPVLPDSS